MQELQPSLAQPAGLSRRLPIWVVGLVALLACAVYANSVENGYAFDDVAVVQLNKHVVNLDWTEVWTDGYWAKRNGMSPDALYRPLTIWSYIANQALAPDQPCWFHLVNVLLHVAVSVLVALLAWRLVGDARVAGVAGILFAVHPLHTEAIANIVGRAELLATFWTLLTLLIFLPQAPLSRGVGFERRAWWHGLLVGACFFAALLCKETPITLPAAIVLIDAWIWVRMARADRPTWWRCLWSRSWRYYLPMTLMVAIYLPMRINACGLMSPARLTSPIVNPLTQATVAERIVTPFLLFAKYLALTFWPATLSADYSMPSIMPTANPFAPLPLTGILVCALAVILSFRLWKRAPQVLLLVGLFFLSYALIANVLRIGTIFGERLFYAPSIFVLILIAWAGVTMYTSIQRAATPETLQGLARRLKPNLARGFACALLAVAVGVMGWRSRERNTDWDGNEALAISTARDNLMSGKACAWAGSVLMASRKTAYEPFALELLNRAIELSPDYAEAHWSIAMYYGKMNDLPRSIIYLAQAARLEPGDHFTRKAVKAAIIDLQKGDPEKYMPVFVDYQKEHPDDETVYLALAMADHAQKKYEEGEANALKALALARKKGDHGEFDEAGAELAQIRFDRGDQLEGVNEFRIYVKNLSHSIDVRCDFAGMLLAGDIKAHPEFLKEADYNLARAESIEVDNPLVRQMRGRLNRMLKGTMTDSVTANADVPHPHAADDLLPTHEKGAP